MGIFTDTAGHRVGTTLGPFPFHHCWGPWHYGSADYVAVYSTSSFWPNVWKSSDGGSTWTEVAPVAARWDIVPYQQINATQFVREPVFDAASGRIYVVHSQQDPGFDAQDYYLAVGYLDLALEEWTTDLAGIGPQFAQKSSVLVGTKVDCALCAHHVVGLRSNGDLIVFYMTRAWKSTTAYYVLSAVNVDVAGGSWGAPFTVATFASKHALPLNCITSANGRTHLFFASYDETYVAYSPTVGPATLHHVCVDSDDTLGTISDITTDYAENYYPWFYTGKSATGIDPNGGKLCVVIGGDDGEPADDWKTLHWVWTADESKSPSWSKIADSLPFPHETADTDYMWSESQTHAYGDSDCTAFYDGSTLRVIAATVHLTSGDVDQSWLWEYTWDGAAWSYEQIDTFTSASAPLRFFGHPTVAKHSGGWGLAVARWSTDDPTNSQQAWVYLIQSTSAGFAYFGVPLAARGTGSNYGWFA